MMPTLRIPFLEFLALIGMMMAIGALSLDMMLPALGELGSDLSLPTANDRQAVVTAFLAGTAAGQLFFGPLSDLWGRKRLLLAGLALFIGGALWAAQAESFAALLAARLLQGFGAAAPRVIATAVVRDLFVGDRMARVMSFAMLVFIIVPIFAPALGQLVLHLGSWRGIFGFFAVFAVVLGAWCAWRLPETHVAGTGRLPRGGIVVQLRADVAEVLRSRVTLGYTFALGFLFSLLMTYVATAQQVFQDIYGTGERFPVVFGSIAALIAAANLVNARLVERFGAGRIAANAVHALAAVCLALVVVCAAGNPPLGVWWMFMGAILFLFALSVPNLNALAMIPMGRVAGTASSFIGVVTTLMATGIGWAIGRRLEADVLPLAGGFLAVASAAALLVRSTSRSGDD